MTDRDPRLDAVAASNLSSAAILAALVGALGEKGVLSATEVREIYEQALLLLESGQGSEPEVQPIYEMARVVIEEQLK